MQDTFRNCHLRSAGRGDNDTCLMSKGNDAREGLRVVAWQTFGAVAKISIPMHLMKCFGDVLDEAFGFIY